MLAGGKGAGTAGRGRPRQPVSGPQESPLPNSQTTTRLPSCAMYTVKCRLQARDSEIYLRMTGGAARRCRQQHMGTNLTCAGRASAHCEPSPPRRTQRTEPCRKRRERLSPPLSQQGERLVPLYVSWQEANSLAIRGILRH